MKLDDRSPPLTASAFTCQLFKSRSRPLRMQLHPGIPTLELGAVSPRLGCPDGISRRTQLCRSLFQEAAQALGDDDHFLNMDAVWVEPYDPKYRRPDKPS